MHNVKDSSENYLEAIYVLSQEGGAVHSVDVARHLDLSRASVSNAVKKLEEEGNLLMEADGRLTLTPSGEAIGRNINDRHQTIKGVLVAVGVSEEQADIDACRVEHAISEESFEKIKAALREH